MVTRFCYYGNREGAELSVADTSGSEKRQEECTLLMALKKRVFRSLCSSCSACPVPLGTLILLINPSHLLHTQSSGPSAKCPSGNFFPLLSITDSDCTKAYREAQEFILHFSSGSIYKTVYCSSHTFSAVCEYVAYSKCQNKHCTGHSDIKAKFEENTQIKSPPK